MGKSVANSKANHRQLGNYRLLKELGAGGMGKVYLAEDLNLQRQVALKVMLPHLASKPKNRERFLREARAAASLNHDHIVAIHQVDEDRGIPYFVMPLLKGESLYDRLQRQKQLPIAVVYCGFITDNSRWDLERSWDIHSRGFSSWKHAVAQTT